MADSEWEVVPSAAAPDSNSDWSVVSDTPAPEPGRVAATARGAAQGGTFGFADEIAGAIGGLYHSIANHQLLSKEDRTKNYQESRDAYRTEDKAAKDAHPNYYMGGEIAGGLAPAVVAGAPTSIAGAAKLGATIGSAAGLGNSKADLTSGGGDAFKTAIADTVKGGALGAATGAVVQDASELVGQIAGKVGQAGARVAAKRLAKLVVGEDSEPVATAFAADPKLAKIATLPKAEAVTALDARLAPIATAKAAALDAVNEAHPATFRDLASFAHAAADDLSHEPNNASAIKAIDAATKDIFKSWNPNGAYSLGKRVVSAADSDMPIPLGKLELALPKFDSSVQPVLRGFIDKHLAALGEDSLATSYRALAEKQTMLSTLRDAIEAKPETSAGDLIKGAFKHGAINTAGHMAAHVIPGANIIAPVLSAASIASKNPTMVRLAGLAAQKLALGMAPQAIVNESVASGIPTRTALLALQTAMGQPVAAQ